MPQLPPFIQPGVHVQFTQATHTYDVRVDPDPRPHRFPSATTILKDQKLYVAPPVKDDVLAHAASRGSNVHTATLFLDEDDLNWDSLTDEEKPYVESYRLWKEQSGFVADHAESPVVCVPYQYCGTPDRWGHLSDGSRCIPDLKSCAASPSTALQLAAYGFAIDPTVIWERYAIELQRSGKCAKAVPYPVEEYLQDVHLFLSATSIYHWRQRQLGKAA